jgi:hypothetical protein
MSKRNFANAVLTAGALTFAVMTFSPAISTELWHVRNHSQIDYAGVRFRTPRGWSARIGPAAAHFEKRPLTVFSHAVLLAWAAVAPTSNPPHSARERDESYSNFAALYSTKLASAEEIEGEPIRVGTGDNEAFCLQSFMKNRTDWFRTTCLVRAGTWRASFEGHQNDKEQFFREVLDLPDPH